MATAEADEYLGLGREEWSVEFSRKNAVSIGWLFGDLGEYVAECAMGCRQAACGGVGEVLEDVQESVVRQVEEAASHDCD